MTVFNRNNNLLSNYKKDIQFFDSPFPHIIIENCLHQDDYDKMKYSFPEESVFLNSGQKVNSSLSTIKFFDMLNNKEISSVNPIFFDFFNYHTSYEFLFEVVKIFNAEVNKRGVKYKEIYEMSKFKDYEDLKKYLEVVNISKKSPSINTNHSPLKNSSIRGVHLDRSKNIFGALFYFKDDIDKDNGGDLELYSWKNKLDFYKKFYFSDPVDVKHVNLVKNIKYDANKIVIFLNSIDSLHAVTDRKINAPIRKYLYLSSDSVNTDVVNKSNIVTKICHKLQNIFTKFS